MNDTVKTSSAVGEGERAYFVDAGTRRLNWYLVGGSAAAALGLTCFGMFETSSNEIRVLIGLLATSLIMFALYGARYNQLATFLYPDRIVSRGLFTQASLRRDDIAGYELIPERSGPPTLKLIPKDPTKKFLRVNRFSPDDAFRDWLSDVPDLRLTPSVLRRKRRANIILAITFGIGWCVLSALGIQQNCRQYEQFISLKSRGITVEGYVRSKSISGRSHGHYLAYTYSAGPGSHSSVLNNEVEINAADYETISIGEEIPVVYDPANARISYPNPNSLLSRINPLSYLSHYLAFWGSMTLFMALVGGGAYIADSKIARKPLPSGGLA